MSEWQPTDAQIVAAEDAHYQAHMHPDPDRMFDTEYVDQFRANAMRAALIAAHRAAPPVDTTEFIRQEIRHQQNVTAQMPNFAFAPHYAIDVLNHLLFALTDGREGKERGRVQTN